MLKAVRIASGRHVFLVDEDLHLDDPERLFDAEYWRSSGYLRSASRGRGSTCFVGDEARCWVWRHFRRGGLFGRIVTDHYLYTGETRVRSFAEWRLLAWMTARELPVPRPVAARYQRTGLIYSADLITREIENAEPLSHRLAEPWPEPELWDTIGRTIRDFHEAGVYHADLNAHNILIRPGGPVYLIDFDKGRIRTPGAWTRQNLDRLHRSLVKITGDEEKVGPGWQRLVAAYRSARRGRS